MSVMLSIQAVLTENLDLWASATERRSGVGRGRSQRVNLYGLKKLRALILDLAVRGKLVRHEARDEPVSELLKAIERGRSRLVKSGQLRKPRDPQSASKLIEPFPLPSTWRWVRLDSIGSIVGGGTPSSNDASNFAEVGEGIPWLTPADLGAYQDLYISRGARDITDKGLRGSSATVMPPGTVLFTSRAPIGYVAIASNSVSTNQGFKSIVPYVPECARYIATVMKAFAPEIDAKAPGTTFKEVSGKIVAEIPFPLPPLAEQNRIVSKVDELMGLCDRLEAVTYDAFVAHQLLVEHLLATLTDCKNSEEFAGNWARLEAHFDTLFTTEASVDQLRQTILQLAIMGKLLPQDANDEPASVLLKRVKVRREELVAQGRARKSKQLPRIMSGEMPFSLPKGWEWCRFDDINDPEFAISYGVLVPGADEENGVPFVRIADLSISDPPEYPEKSISSDVDAQYARTRLMGGEILMGVVGSVGKLGVAPQSWAGANIARAICRIVPSKELHHAYALWLLQSQFMQKNFRGDTRTLAQPTLNINLIRSAITPIPPYQEQLRIAGRLDALSSLCDDLKSRFKDANDQKLLLADAIVAKAVA